ncbi:MAG TPA: polyketide synthase, partial [Candidatus Angelobacter sp.]
MSSIAIIGMACRYPDARSPRQLWENTLAQRRSFRRIPEVRLCVDDYSAEGQAADRISLRTAAVLEDYEFDRVRFQVSKETFASTDLVHWLALDVAAQALEDAKLLDADDSRRERMGVYVGNSLTGEFSRANLLRLRWPYLRRVLTSVLQKKTQNGDLHKLLEEIEALYKTPFPATTEESLAGGLSNTIAGRICNYFNLKGGGYTVDGACASSLLAVATACSALESGDIDIAIAGGVDLSLDPFELAGFSKLGALATKQMRVFDAHSEGFWPGEGCGMVVLMRHEEAIADQRSPYAVMRGWGISSDGSGGITRPEISGQLLALRRAYQRAGYGIDSVSYIEGHGTGTSVGDAVELQALTQARREAKSQAAPAAIGSIKANIGHTKAAAGVAGLIKATMAIRARVMPPTTGCDTPHPELMTEGAALRVLRTGELWPNDVPVRAGVSAMGFGGINTHVTLEACDTVRRKSFTTFEQNLISSKQDCELFLFQSPDAEHLSIRLQEVLDIAGEISFSEMADLAAYLAGEINSLPDNWVRAA